MQIRVRIRGGCRTYTRNTCWYTSHWSNYTLQLYVLFLQLYVLIYVATIRSFFSAYTRSTKQRIVALRRCIVATYSDAKKAYMCKSGCVYVAYAKIGSPDVLVMDHCPVQPGTSSYVVLNFNIYYKTYKL